MAIGSGKLTKGIGISYYGDFTGGVLMPIVIALPYALVAAVVGASVTWIVESDRPIGWTLVPTFLYALGVFDPHWRGHRRLSSEWETRSVGCFLQLLVSLAE